MQGKELTQHLFGLTAPWTFSEVKLDMQSREISERAGRTRNCSEIFGHRRPKAMRSDSSTIVVEESFEQP
jgi:hypothetical protein